MPPFLLNTPVTAHATSEASGRAGGCLLTQGGHVEPQTLINGLFGLLGLLGGWMLNRIWAAVDHLQTNDQVLTDKVQSIELLVAGTYVKREDMEKRDTILFAKLDRIEQKLDAKVDK